MKTKGRRIDTLEKGKEKGWGIHDEVEYKGQPNQDKAPKKKKDFPQNSTNSDS